MSSRRVGAGSRHGNQVFFGLCRRFGDSGIFLIGPVHNSAGVRQFDFLGPIGRGFFGKDSDCIGCRFVVSEALNQTQAPRNIQNRIGIAF